MTAESLEDEVTRLRAEVAAYRQRELEALRSQLAEAITAAQHYRSEAERNAETGRQIHAGMQEEVNRLRSQLEIKEQVARQIRRRSDGNAKP